MRTAIYVTLRQYVNTTALYSLQ